MAKTSVVVVESPAKAKTINKYLGNEYIVIASFGHVRDLPPKDGSVQPDENFAMKWQLDERGKKQIAMIASALKGAKKLILATDPDREGEAISWHVRSALEEQKLLKNIDVQRVTFNEITKNAILGAMAAPRQLDQPLIDAYLARRALDYLVGFTLSPVLWRKLPGSRSAGRVQSVALRLICEREAEIEVFKPREYWDVVTQLLTSQKAPFEARLTHLHGKKLEQFDLPDEKTAFAARDIVRKTALQVLKTERKKTRRNPAPPFTTSTLQQEASRKLGMSAQVTMRIAQQLYEGVDLHGETVGLITYMRTDGVTMAAEAVTDIRKHINKAFGAEYCPAQPRTYVTKTKNAQEAHEAVRPTGAGRTPKDVAHALTNDQKRLYELIWKRAVASQMQSAQLDQTMITIGDDSRQTLLRATGSIITFDGFLRLYREGQDDLQHNRKQSGDNTQDEEQNRLLPPMEEGQPLATKEVLATQHFTQPPPRYSEASLVKKMEEIGIGRPSTYASILSVLRDRNYVKLENRRFMPEDRGRLVTAFLTSFFERYVDTGFTASLEEQLDDISDGRADWHDVMAAFWRDFFHTVEQTKDLKISDVIDALDKDLGEHFFPTDNHGLDPRQCPSCGTGRLGLKLGRHGAFLGCSNYPDCKNTRPLAISDQDNNAALGDGPHSLGHDPQTGEEITLRRGPYGLYIQRGEANPDDKSFKPKRAAIPKNLLDATSGGEGITLEQALGLLSLPRFLGNHPETGQKIEAGLGRFGPYVKMGSIYGTLDKDDDILNVGLNRAIDALARKLASIRHLGAHPDDGADVMIRKGRFGPYVQHGQIVANLPKDRDMNDVTMQDALALLAEKGKPLKGGKKATKTKTSGKTAAKPETGSKTAQKKKTSSTAKTKTAKTTTVKTDRTSASATKKSKTAKQSTIRSKKVKKDAV